MPLIRRRDETPPGAAGEDADGRKLGSGTVDERWAAARALSGDAHSVKILAVALGVEQDARVREAIMTSLARIGTPEAAEAIARLVRSGEASVRTSALDALRIMPTALETHLGRLLADGDPDVRLLACDLARHLPGPLATKMLDDLLEREAQANVCAAAVEVLADCGGPEALPSLGRCAQRFADIPFLTFSVRIASERIRAQVASDDG